MGCDTYILVESATGRDFNPRTHRGVRRMGTSEVLNVGKFQSTHPSWGATLGVGLNGGTFTDFNPRTHRGVRH